MNEAAALPITGGSVVRPAQSVLRPPPTPTRQPLHFPAQTGYRTRRSGGSSQSAGPGRASPVPAATFSTFHAPYAGRSLGAAIQALHPFHGLRREYRGSAPPDPAQRRAPNDAAGFA